MEKKNLPSHGQVQNGENERERTKEASALEGRPAAPDVAHDEFEEQVQQTKLQEQAQERQAAAEAGE